MEKPKKQLFLVDSYCDDQQESYWDVVPAETEEQAQELIEKVRGNYAKVTYVVSIKDFLDDAKRIGRMSLKSGTKSFTKLMDQEGKKFCKKCGNIADVHDGCLCEEGAIGWQIRR